MKRVVFLGIVVLLIFGLIGCGGQAAAAKEYPTPTVQKVGVTPTVMPTVTQIPTATPVSKKLTPTPTPFTVTPTPGREYNTLGEVVYIEHPSAKGKANVMPSMGYPARGNYTFYREKAPGVFERVFYSVVGNTSRNILKFTLFVSWKDASGKTIKTEKQAYCERVPNKCQFLPGEIWTDIFSFTFPDKAVSLEFWVEVEDLYLGK